MSGIAWARCRGFTLVEVIVVLALLGILAGVVAPALRGAAETDPVSAAGEELRALLETARRTALGRARDVTVLVDPARAAYAVLVEGDSVHSATAQGSLHLASDTRLEGGALRFRISFHPGGWADGDSLRVVGAGSMAVVGVDRWTGTPHVRRPR